MTVVVQFLLNLGEIILFMENITEIWNPLILLEILSLEQARWSGCCMLGAWVGFVFLCVPLAELY